MTDTDLTIIITLAALTGFIIGAIARQSELRRRTAEAQKSYAAFCAAMNLYGEQMAMNYELRRINHQLGHAMQEAGLEVRVIGECTCEAEDEEIEQVWLPEQEASR